MALENQPLFQAPSLPKMGKGSSPLMSGAKTIGFSFAKPKLKASKMSFVRAKKAKAIKAEDLKGPETVSTGSLATTLTETNRILVEIQNQLAIDFANRIAEKRQTLKLSRKTVRKKKLGEKEQFVERGVKLQKSANTFTKKVLAPVKGIFDKILEFLSIVGGGILLNNAWEWLKDENNRKNLVKIFQFLKTYWKEILIGLLTVKVIGAIAKLVGFANTLRKIFNRLKGLGRRPPGSGGTTPGPNKGGPSGGCGPVTGKGGCLDQLSATSSVANKLAETLFATGFAVNYFKRFAVKVKEKEKEAEQQATPPPEVETKPELTPLEKIRRKAIPAEVQEYVGPLLQKYFSDLTIFGKTKTQSVQTPMGQLIVEPTSKNIFTGDDTPKFRFISKEEQDYKSQQTQLMLDNPWIKTFFGAQTALDYASMVMTGRPGAGVRAKSPFMGLRSMNLSKFRTSIKNRLGQLKLRLPDRQADRLAEAAAREAQSPAFHRALLEQRVKDGKFVVDDTVVLDEALKKVIQGELSGTSGGDLYVGSGGRKGLEELRRALDNVYVDNPTPKVNVQPESQFRGSMGGTVFGQGSQTVDSVPAMLAPGEEVIRSASANIFRPVLKDINDNAGRMFVAFRDGVNLMKRNNDLQVEESKRTIELFQKFDDILKKEVSNIEREKLKKALDMAMLVNNIPIPQQQSGSPFQLMSNNTVEQPLPPQTIRVIHTESDPSLNQYGHRRTPKEGKIETLSMNMAPNVIDLSQKQEQPKEQPKESSATDIIISPVDPDNPFFGRTFTSLGVEL